MASLKSSFGAKLSQAVQARAGVDRKVPKQPYILTTEDSPQEIRRRNIIGSLPRTPLADVFQDEITQAIYRQALGYYDEAVRISQLTMTDSWVNGVMGSLTSSVASLPRVFDGDEEAKRDLASGYNGGDSRSVFDVMVRPSVIRQVSRDLRFHNTALCELIWLEDLDFPIMSPMDLRHLRQDPQDNRWYYNTAIGQPMEIVPGNGRFVLFTPSPNIPWEEGVVFAIARDYARKQEALLNCDEYLRRHASPIRKGTSPIGATDESRDGYLEQLIAWTGPNSSVVLPPGWDLGLVETQGQGYQAYGATVTAANESITIGISGQSVTTTGAQGFANGDMGLVVREDLRNGIADEISFTITEQLMPYYMQARFGSVDRKVSFKLSTAEEPEGNIDAFAATVKALAEAAKICKEVGITMPVPDIAALMEKAGVQSLTTVASPPALKVVS